jgi:hypothetical protein
MDKRSRDNSSYWEEEKSDDNVTSKRMKNTELDIGEIICDIDDSIHDNIYMTIGNTCHNMHYSDGYGDVDDYHDDLECKNNNECSNNNKTEKKRYIDEYFGIKTSKPSSIESMEIDDIKCHNCKYILSELDIMIKYICSYCNQIGCLHCIQYCYICNDMFCKKCCILNYDENYERYICIDCNSASYHHRK